MWQKGGGMFYHGIGGEREKEEDNRGGAWILGENFYAPRLHRVLSPYS